MLQEGFLEKKIKIKNHPCDGKKLFLQLPNCSKAIKVLQHVLIHPWALPQPAKPSWRERAGSCRDGTGFSGIRVRVRDSSCIPGGALVAEQPQRAAWEELQRDRKGRMR